jgi:hypothetical protein
MTEGKRRKQKKSSKKKKKGGGGGGGKKIPWYMQEELIREQQERERQERDAEEARIKMEEEQRWFESLTPAEREQVEVKKSSETRRAFWQQFYVNKSEEEENRKRREEEISIMREKRAEEKAQRARLAEQGQLELDYGNVVMEKVFFFLLSPPYAFPLPLRSFAHSFSLLMFVSFCFLLFPFLSLLFFTVQHLCQDSLSTREDFGWKPSLPQTWLF